MGGSKKSKRVTWASDVNLCQVKLFLAEDSPTQVGMGTEDHLQAKPLWQVQSGSMGSEANLPPGFEGVQPGNLWRVKLPQIPLVKWKTPPRFVINSNWRVAAGEESTEVEAQTEREMRVLEAIYPRPSAIPPNPATSGVEDSKNDLETPLIPVMPIEDEDNTPESSFGFTAANSSSMIPQLQHGMLQSQGSAGVHPNNLNGVSATGVEPDIVAAAQAALSSIMSNAEQGNLIDRDLLIKILSDPKMVERLVTNHGASSGAHTVSSSVQTMLPSSGFQSTQHFPSSNVQIRPAISSTSPKNIPSPSLHNLPSITPQYTPDLRPVLKNNSLDSFANRRDPFSPNVIRPEHIAASICTVTEPFGPPNSMIGSMSNLRPSMPDAIPAPPPPGGIPVKKDINYYKSLIQQHGSERRETFPQYPHRSNQPLGTSQDPTKSRDSKPKTTKPCIYFNSARGCRNGANCTFQHDTNLNQQRVNNVPDAQSAKRVKLDREN